MVGGFACRERKEKGAEGHGHHDDDDDDDDDYDVDVDDGDDDARQWQLPTNTIVNNYAFRLADDDEPDFPSTRRSVSASLACGTWTLDPFARRAQRGKTPPCRSRRRTRRASVG